MQGGRFNNYDIIGFASGIYFSKFSKAVLDFAGNLPQEKAVFLIYTYGINDKGYTKAMEQIIAAKSCQLLGTYGCRGLIPSAR